MEVSRINNYQKSNTSFTASLKVAENLYESTYAISRKQFDNVINIFRKKLAADPLNASDVVQLRKLTKDPKEVCAGEIYVTPGHWESTGSYQQKFVRDTYKTGYGGSKTEYVPGYYTHNMNKENMEIAINKSRTGFFFNGERNDEQIAEDMYNAYKHVRYLEHYKK